MTVRDLPIYGIADALQDALKRRRPVIIHAPTGSGKSTQVPKLVGQALDSSGRVLVLQPRRLAARMLACRVSAECNLPVGGWVGYQTRFESRRSADTRVLFMSEGILPRLFLQDEPLADVAAVIFDEFHERHLAGDLGLALVSHCAARDVQVIVMSATLALEQVKAHLPDHVLLEVDCPRYPLDIRYLPPQPQRPVWKLAAAAVQKLVKQTAGDVLVFMPGQFEIHQTVREVRATHLPEEVVVHALHGSMTADAQDEVMAPSALRKVIVATNVAETSLTIPGVRHVVDSGLVRVHHFEIGRGFSELSLQRVSRSSAEQRAGRAGREAPGCVERLWSQAEHENLTAQDMPEIHRTDLCETVTFIAALGQAIDTFSWFEAPSTDALLASQAVLVELGIIDAAGTITALGRELAQFPLHPRLAVLLHEAARSGCLPVACMVAALLGERSLALTGSGVPNVYREFDNALAAKAKASSKRSDGDSEPLSDLFALLNALRFAKKQSFAKHRCADAGVQAAVAKRVWQQMTQYERWFATKRRPNPREGQALIRALIRSYPNHLARRVDAGQRRYQLADGRHGELTASCSVDGAELILAVEVMQTSGRGLQLGLVSQVELADLVAVFPDRVQQVETHVWDRVSQGVERGQQTVFGTLIVAEKRSLDVEPDIAAEQLAVAIRRGGLMLKGWDAQCDLWVARVRWLASQFPERGLIEYDESDMDIVIAELCHGERRYQAVRNRPCLPFAKNVLSYEDQHFVEQMAPERIELPTGRRLRIAYDGERPKLRAKIQDLYDVQGELRIAGGRYPLLLEILGPNMRPVQVTDDLPGFWANLYPQIRPQLARRYPKHEWREL